MQEVTVSLAAAKEVSMNTAVAGLFELNATLTF